MCTRQAILVLIHSLETTVYEAKSRVFFKDTFDFFCCINEKQLGHLLLVDHSHLDVISLFVRSKLLYAGGAALFLDFEKLSRALCIHPLFRAEFKLEQRDARLTKHRFRTAEYTHVRPLSVEGEVMDVADVVAGGELVDRRAIHWHTVSLGRRPDA